MTTASILYLSSAWCEWTGQCYAGQPNTDKNNGVRLANETVKSEGICCHKCANLSGCTTWIFATDAGAAANNCTCVSYLSTVGFLLHAVQSCDALAECHLMLLNRQHTQTQILASFSFGFALGRPLFSKSVHCHATCTRDSCHQLRFMGDRNYGI
jgi:hypothetical protein